MASFKLQCWKEQIRCVGFKETAEQMLAFNEGDRVVISGKIQPSNWEKDGTKVYSYQVIVDEIEDDTDKKDKQWTREQISTDPPPNERNMSQYDYKGGPF